MTDNKPEEKVETRKLRVMRAVFNKDAPPPRGWRGLFHRDGDLIKALCGQSLPNDLTKATPCQMGLARLIWDWLAANTALEIQETTASRIKVVRRAAQGDSGALALLGLA
ncbi:MAG TPA: hypothetical protein VLF21_00665 [Candidatus Saccharimonadales bacterium]|nr:hypothetical protein [Candidatus Saccharimonadales bacterium]